jgi:hypothetical protein
MRADLSGFRSYFEASVHSLKKQHGGHKKHHSDPEDHLNAIGRELSVHMADLPQRFTTGPIEMGDRMYNTACWRLLQPVEDDAHYIRIQLDPEYSPNLDQNTYLIMPGGEKISYHGDPDTKVYLIKRKTLVDILSRPWQSAGQGGAGGAPPGGGMPPGMGM